MILDIYLEGPDLSGKTTSLRAINKELNYMHYISDRGYFCNWVYADYYGRDNRHMWKDKLMTQNEMDNVIYVMFYFENRQPLDERYAIRGDECHDADGIWKVNQAYIERMDAVKNKIVVPIKDNMRSPESIAKYVGDKVREYIASLNQ